MGFKHGTGGSSSSSSSPAAVTNEEEDDHRAVSSASALSLADIHVDVSPLRFAVLAVNFCLGLANQFMYVSNANIVDELSEYLSCPKFNINMLAVIYALVYAIAGLPSCEVINRIGLRWGLVCALVFNAAGAVTRFVAVSAVQSFPLLFVGQLLGGVAQVFMLALPPLLAATWFPTTERSVATAVSSLSGLFGTALGFSVPPSLVNAAHKDKSAFALLFGLQAAFCLVNLCGAVLIKPHPPHPPSVTSPQYVALLLDRAGSPRSSGRQRDVNYGGADDDGTSAAQLAEVSAAVDASEEQSILDKAAPPNALAQMWSQRHNSAFLCVVFAYGVGGGMLTSIGSVLSQLVRPFGVGEAASGYALLVGLLSGCVFGIAASPLLDKYRRYRWPMATLLILCGAINGLFAVALRFAPEGARTFVPITYVTIALLAMVTLPTLPISLEFAVEVTYPLPEPVSSTVCMWANCVFASIGTFGLSAIIGNSADKSETVTVVATISGMIGVCGILVAIFAKEDLKRLAAENERASTASLASSSSGLP